MRKKQNKTKIKHSGHVACMHEPSLIQNRSIMTLCAEPSNSPKTHVFYSDRPFILNGNRIVDLTDACDVEAVLLIKTSEFK